MQIISFSNPQYAVKVIHNFTYPLQYCFLFLWLWLCSDMLKYIFLSVIPITSNLMPYSERASDNLDQVI